MVQIAILCVLVVIAVLLAPWLLAVIATAVALYGIYLVAAAAVFAVVFVVALMWFLFTGSRRRDAPQHINGDRKACRQCQVEIAATARRCSNCGAAS